MNPEEYGWRLVKEKYHPVQGYSEPCPKEIASQLCCSCRKDCSSQLCSCRKSGVDCTNACRCSEDCVIARVIMNMKALMRATLMMKVNRNFMQTRV